MINKAKTACDITYIEYRNWVDEECRRGVDHVKLNALKLIPVALLIAPCLPTCDSMNLVSKEKILRTLSSNKYNKSWKQFPRTKIYMAFLTDLLHGAVFHIEGSSLHWTRFLRLRVLWKAIRTYTEPSRMGCMALAWLSLAANDNNGEMSNNYDSDGAYITLLVGKEHVEATLLSVVTLEDNNGNKDDQHGVCYL
ncbi:hypothetical protein VNO77_27563 [Canavalia gladiata]|uniref:Uncharacterized protein n=1 Tax=Canavalia gladiata TaxID=3824 RepID=A0AAN9Q766_CANGL